MKHYAKAIVAGLVAALSWAIPVVDDGLVASEVLGIILAGLTGSGLVYAVPNRPRGQDVRVRGDAGALTLLEACVLGLFVVALLFAVGLLPRR